MLYMRLKYNIHVEIHLIVIVKSPAGIIVSLVVKIYYK